VAEQVTLTLPDDLARRVREVASSTHQELEEVLLEWIDRTSTQISLPTPVEQTEATLLQQVNLGFPADWWNHYQTLIADRQAETIGEANLAELIEMSEALEMANVKRVEALGEIAQLRGCLIEQVMEALEIELKTETDV
jgi:hypothetical protein